MDKYLNLHREMISLRGLTDHTIKSYSSYIKMYLDYVSEFLNKSPEDVSWDEMRGFIRYIQNTRNLSDRTINHIIAQLHFFVSYVLHKPWDSYQLPKRKFDTYVPYVPTKQETMDFISTMPNLKWRTMLAVLYSAGLRIGELCNLRYDDISRSTMRIHIRHSKSRMERYAMLSELALDLLTKYWFDYGEPREWLFPMKTDMSKPINTSVLSKYIHEYEQRL